MAERKTVQTRASVKDFLATLPNDRRRADAQIVIRMMKAISGKQARMWGPSIIGFDVSRYLLANGREEEICKIGFSPRAQALVFYLGHFEGRADLLKALGKHKISGGGCIYINKLADVDIDVLEQLIARAYQHTAD